MIAAEHHEGAEGDVEFLVFEGGTHGFGEGRAAERVFHRCDEVGGVAGRLGVAFGRWAEGIGEGVEGVADDGEFPDGALVEADGGAPRHAAGESGGGEG